ncbi:hypothetical protein [Klebsiella variicola]|uniref:hypothetical protein n=1 Tax=Klebsiella variicola TaxID=244366 RepID=UPI002B05691E|nr:hypothetical protein [Klebsiella variicola]
MTTDITELAQREKFEAWWEREYKHLESSKYTDAVPHIKYGFWMAYQAGGAELVEALEKAQQRNTSQREYYEGVIEDGGKRISELESFRTAYMEWSDKTDWVRTDRRFDVVKALGKHIADVLKSYIEHLESRTVKLPEPFKFAKSSSGLAYYYADEVDAALTAAGIKVEAE